MKTRIAPLLLLLGMAAISSASPPSMEESQRQAQVLATLKASLSTEENDAGRFLKIARVLKEEPDVDLRRRVLETAMQIPGPHLEQLLTDLLKSEGDGGLRSMAATALGHLGSEKVLPTLARTAATDPTTSWRMGCIAMETSARGAATFALVEFATRFPPLAKEAVAHLQALPVPAGPRDNEGLANARQQALFQLTRDPALLKPFFIQLQSPDPLERVRGVTAFRGLQLKSAPPELVAALQDSSSDVRSYAALALGEGSDPAAIVALMKIAGDPKEERNVRCNAIFALGQMKASAAAPLMEKLLTDPDAAVPSNAAVALFRITGKKVEKFPEGYRTE